jgi:hypothetical protein
MLIFGCQGVKRGEGHPMHWCGAEVSNGLAMDGCAVAFMISKPVGWILLV